MREHAKAQFTDYIDQWGEVIEQGKATGEFDSNTSAGVFKHLLFGALDHAVVTWIQNPNRRTEDLKAIVHYRCAPLRCFGSTVQRDVSVTGGRVLSRVSVHYHVANHEPTSCCWIFRCLTWMDSSCSNGFVSRRSKCLLSSCPPIWMKIR